MSCSSVRQKLEAYVQGVLSDRERASCEEHLSFCRQCQRELRLLQHIDAALREEPLLTPAASFTAEVSKKISASRRLVRTPLNWTLRQAAAVLACLLWAGVASLLAARVKTIVALGRHVAVDAEMLLRATSRLLSRFVSESLFLEHLAVILLAWLWLIATFALCLLLRSEKVRL